MVIVVTVVSVALVAILRMVLGHDSLYWYVEQNLRWGLKCT